MLKPASYILPFTVIISVLILLMSASSASAASCKDLKILKLDHAVVTDASAVKGEPGTTQQPLPSYCRVQLDLKPSEDSLIKMEMWLPLKKWNGKFMGVGNGFFAGSIQGKMNEMPDALKRGYATAGTDTGHQEPGGEWAIGHPEKMIDFAYRSTHEMTLKAKKIIRAFYGRNAEHSYFKGCSTGGRQALMEAQRYPDDYNGIIAGSCANRHVHMWTSSIAQSVDLYNRPEGNLSEAKALLVNSMIMEECDKYNEGFLNNPHLCKADFTKLLCKENSNEASCLTSEKLKTVDTFYNGVRNSKGELIFSGQALGNPIPANIALNQGPGAVNILFDIVRIAFNNPDLDWRKFDLNRDLPLIDKAVGYVDAVDPDLNRFKSLGGKLLLTHGWSDTGITPETTIWYYKSVLDNMGKNQDNWMRLFLAPGMGHCGGGPGVNSFDAIGVLEKWVEKGTAPEVMMGSGKNGFTRPMCPYPEYAEYKGSGDIKDAGNWYCIGQ